MLLVLYQDMHHGFYQYHFQKMVKDLHHHQVIKVLRFGMLLKDDVFLHSQNMQIKYGVLNMDQKMIKLFLYQKIKVSIYMIALHVLYNNILI